MTNSSTFSRDLQIILQNDNFFDERCAYKMESNFFTFFVLSSPNEASEPAAADRERASDWGGGSEGGPAGYMMAARIAWQLKWIFSTGKIPTEQNESWQNAIASDQ